MSKNGISKIMLIELIFLFEIVNNYNEVQHWCKYLMKFFLNEYLNEEFFYEDRSLIPQFDI